jgi:hypothetical protein
MIIIIIIMTILTIKENSTIIMIIKIITIMISAMVFEQRPQQGRRLTAFTIVLTTVDAVGLARPTCPLSGGGG